MTVSATILLVEDDQALLEGIADLLEVSEIGYSLHVLKATNGQKGLQLLASHVPDLIISDIMMPVMGGFEFLEKVRQSPAWVHIPVIFLTAKGTKHDVLRGRMSGAELYIKKPYDSDELLQLVKSQLDRAFELRAGRQRKISTVSRDIVQLLHHEFRTPLTYVTAYHSLLAAGLGEEDEAELRDYLDGIYTGAQRMSTLVGKLLRVLALWTGEAAEEYEQQADVIDDLSANLRALCEQFAAELVEVNGTFNCEIQSDLPPWFGKLDYIEEILRQLLQNALVFSTKVADRQPEVTLTAAIEDDCLLVSVKDNGIGIPASVQEEIFDLFYQYDRSELEQQGAGAGLTIARGLAELHGGQIEVKSEVGAGSTFTVRLPSSKPTISQTAPKTDESFLPATILLVEDEEYLLRGLKDLLETFTNRYHLSVLAATDGLQALQILATEMPDLIISDIMMPRMNGYQFLTEVRANPRWVDIPVVFLTAKGERQDVLLGLSSGAEEYITKPYDVDELFAVVSAQLDRRFLRQGVTEQSLERMKVGLLELLLTEFRVPLDDVKQYTDQLGDSLANVDSFGQLQRYLEGLENGSNHVARLVEDFILLVELRTGESVDWYKLQARPTGVDTVLQSAGPRLQASYDWLEVEIRYNLDGGADEALISQQLLNTCIERLAEVVIGQCPDGGSAKLVLSSAATNGQILIQVGSPVATMDSETVERLDSILASPRPFEPVLSEISLALLLVKGIVNYHDGQLSVMSGPGRGLTFVIALPAY